MDSKIYAIPLNIMTGEIFLLISPGCQSGRFDETCKIFMRVTRSQSCRMSCLCYLICRNIRSGVSFSLVCWEPLSALCSMSHLVAVSLPTSDIALLGISACYCNMFYWIVPMFPQEPATNCSTTSPSAWPTSFTTEKSRSGSLKNVQTCKLYWFQIFEDF